MGKRAVKVLGLPILPKINIELPHISISKKLECYFFLICVVFQDLQVKKKQLDRISTCGDMGGGPSAQLCLRSYPFPYLSKY